MQEPKKSEIYSFGNFDLKFDAKQALGGRRTHESILLWSPYVIGQTIIFSSCSFFFLLSSFFFLSFFSSPNLSGRRLDVYHTLAHGVALVRI